MIFVHEVIQEQRNWLVTNIVSYVSKRKKIGYPTLKNYCTSRFSTIEKIMISFLEKPLCDQYMLCTTPTKTVL